MVREIIAARGLRAVYQPIVELDGGQTVGFEALIRGPVGTDFERPDQLFAEARRTDALEALDEACREAAFHGAVQLGITAPLTLFVNVEPDVLDAAPLGVLAAIAASASGGLRVVFEITERALALRPAELLRTVERIRAQGWAVALDDVGAEPASLAFLSLLRPEVVKLDLRLIHDRPSAAVAEIMNAVNAYAERSGAAVLAEGIETPEHLAKARALGARLGQGWLFGRPAPTIADGPTGFLSLPTLAAPVAQHLSPFSCLDPDLPLRTSTKRLLVEISKHLEREALRLGETCVVAATFQYAHHFTPDTARRYARLAETVGFVCALGEDLPSEPIAGVRGARLRPDDAILGEWDLVVLSPHFAAALLARDLGDTGPDRDRRFEFAVTYRRDIVERAATALLGRVAPPVAARLSLPGQAPWALAA